MNALTNFAFEEHLVRVVIKDDEPWFIASDVCKCLGLSNPSKTVQNLDNDEKGVSSSYTLGGEQELLIVSEGGLYTIILRSRLATTPGSVPHRFRKWVTSEVLPQIRRTGRYQPGGLQPAPPLEGEPLPFDRRQALAEVREARLIFGPAAARALWSQSPHLPRVPEMEASLIASGDDSAECLRFLLDSSADADMRTVLDLAQAAIDGETEAAAALERMGMRPTHEGLWLDPAKPEMRTLWKSSRWRSGLWIGHLRRLPGVTGNHPRMTIGGHQCRPIWLPANLLA